MFSACFYRLTLLLGALLTTLSSAQAGIVDFTATALGGGIWLYDYTVNNNSPSLGFDELTIYFDPSTFSSLGTVSTAAGWDLILVQPDKSKSRRLRICEMWNAPASST